MVPHIALFFYAPARILTGAQDDDGFILYESRAICRYLSEKYADQGTPLYPRDLKQRALVEQGAAVEMASFDPPAMSIRIEKFVKP